MGISHRKIMEEVAITSSNGNFSNTDFKPSLTVPIYEEL